MKSFFQHGSDDRDYCKEAEDESEESQEDEPFASCRDPSDKPKKSEDDREYYNETEWNKFGRPPHYFSKKRKRSCGIQNPFLEHDSEYDSESVNVLQDEEESLAEAPRQHSPKSDEFGRRPDSSGAKEARPVGSTNAKSVNKKASID